MISFSIVFRHARPCRMGHRDRQGSIAVLAAILMVVMLAMIAFTVDIGYLVSTRAEMQRAADAAALGGALEMVSEEAISEEHLCYLNYMARQKAAEVAAQNVVIHTNPSMRLFEDIDVGHLDDPNNRNEALSYWNPSSYNTFQVRLRFDGDSNQPLSFFFAPVLGINSANLSVTAAATFSRNNTIGFHADENVEHTSLIPFAIKLQDWLDMLAGAGNDDWSYDPETGEVEPGWDDIREIKMFPAKEQGSTITPGNFGTVDIGNPNNSAADLVRQISQGISAEDLSYLENNEVKLNPETGTLILNGDTGISAAIKAPLSEIIGKPRTICLYESVSGVGDNAYYTIVGFAGIRILDVKLTGGDKYVIIQPGMVSDATAIVGDSQSSYYIGPPVHLVR